MRRLVSSLAVLLALVASAQAEVINVLSWNVESGQAEPEVIADQIGAFEGYELLGFSEVDPDDAAGYASACTEGESANFEFLLGTTGSNDRLMLVWNSDRFEALQELELMHLRAQTGRAPLAVKLRERNTTNTFWFMVNHLHRGSEIKRNQQAAGLRQWFIDQSIPVVACGDYNMDVVPSTGLGNEAFDIIRQGDHVRWVEPQPRIPTQSSAHQSILDFFFVNDDAISWQISSRIIRIPSEFEPVNEKSDHRPIDATINIPTVTPSPFTRGRGFGPLAANSTERPIRGTAERSGHERGNGMNTRELEIRPRSSDNRSTDEALLDEIKRLREQLERLEQKIRERR